MNSKLTTSAILIGTLALPIAGYTADTGTKNASSPAGSSTERYSPKTAVKDSIITTKIKAAMTKDKQVSALNISVDTDDKGVVTLSGKAKSKTEADKAVALARGVDGVVSVKNKIQVMTN